MPNPTNTTSSSALLALKEQLENLIDTQNAPKAASAADKAAAKQSGGKLAIVVGHTKTAPGAYGIAPINASEYPWNSDLAQRIVAECESKGVLCKVFFRDNIGISGAYKLVKDWGATAAIELHFNAFKGATRGTETIYGVSFSGSEAWAKRVQTAMVALYGRTGKQDRGILKAPPYDRGRESVNALNDRPSCLIEPFFGDNAADAKLGNDYKTSLAKTLVASFIEHFKGTVPKLADNVSPVVTDLASYLAPLKLRYFTAAEILKPTYNVNNGVSNSRPPQNLWPNIVATIVVLDEIRHQAGVPIGLNSTYRSKAYNNTLGGAAAQSQHLDFRAIDFASSKMKPSALVKIARQMLGKTFTIPMSTLTLVKDQAPLNAAGLKIKSSGGKTTFEFHGGISEYPSFVHIDCRGTDATWG